MKINTLKILVCCFISFFYFQNSYGQTKAIGFIRIEMIIKELPHYGNDSLQINQLNDEYNTLFDEKIKRLKQEINGVVDEDKLQIYQLEIENLQLKEKVEINKIEMKAEEEMDLYLRQKIKEFCIQNQVSFILAKKEFLYCENCTDYTDAFLAYLKDNK